MSQALSSFQNGSHQKPFPKAQRADFNNDFNSFVPALPKLTHSVQRVTTLWEYSHCGTTSGGGDLVTDSHVQVGPFLDRHEQLWAPPSVHGLFRTPGMAFRGEIHARRSQEAVRGDACNGDYHEHRVRHGDRPHGLDHSRSPSVL